MSFGSVTKTEKVLFFFIALLLLIIGLGYIYANSVYGYPVYKYNFSNSVAYGALFVIPLLTVVEIATYMLLSKRSGTWKGVSKSKKRNYLGLQAVLLTYLVLYSWFWAAWNGGKAIYYIYLFFPIAGGLIFLLVLNSLLRKTAYVSKNIHFDIVLIFVVYYLLWFAVFNYLKCAEYY